MTKTKCKCGQCFDDVLVIRAAKGLLPLCELASPAPMAREGFESYGEAAAARKTGQKVKSVGGLTTGSPTRFVLVTRR
jgi:hypothetical protein